ncbi:transglycosylase SLT domain-containing protein [Marinobacterium litorale]|uniref:transglycosylase SLT domain-containing protein n=1 Tax=Marinobacterium litorale TaxID=404770 RepID=UPI00042A62B7|nr:transglycosylase SLT domain-containing protein [Marinobacterium litorale]
MKFAVAWSVFWTLVVLFVLAPLGEAAEIPHAAHQYRQELTRQARLVWGLDAPLAVMAAQVHQESYWNPKAISPVGAEGLGQFMPRTAEWMPDIDPVLAQPVPFNPRWSLRALARYDRWLHSRLKADTNCDRWAMTLSAYNGGLGWVLRDKALAVENGHSRWLWWDNVERYNAGRSAANFRENRHYPRRILHELTPRYAAAGWGEGVCF